MSVSINGAAQVLRTPGDGLEYLRSDRASELTLEPGSLWLDGGAIAAHEGAGDAELQIDASGCAVLPGLVDCHTHLPFAGWREREYALKVSGASYEEVARAGGGIRSSSRALAHATDEEVLAQATTLAGEMLAHGTTTFECKSGYGLSPTAEVRAVALAVELRHRVPQTVTSTALLAHTVPEGYDADGWMEEVADMLPAVVKAGDPTALDIYVESVAFGNEHLRRMGELAAANSLDLRAHVEQFNTNHSVPVALAAGARSVDHVTCIAAEEIEPLARSQTAAVLLPGAEFLGDERVAPARELADAGAICALASDLNPGTSPVVSLPVIIGLAVRRYRWSVREALLGCTLNAAWVMGVSDRLGSLEAGKRADLLIVDGPVERIPYRFGRNPVAVVLIAGEVAYVRPDQGVENRPVSVAERLAGLEGIGNREDGIWRLAWTAEDAACAEWFEGQAAGAGLEVRRDPAGNLWAFPDSDAPWWGLGSHLDSVRGGGRFDGPLGVACGFEVAAAVEVPLAVIAFEDEEGARFNTPTFGSKALAGRLDLPTVLERRDDDGITIAEAMRAAGVDPGRVGDAPQWVGSLAGFVEVHIDQTRELARAESPVGIITALANRMRLELGFDGRADHAGTTPREERQDALAAAARAIVAAEELSIRHSELTVTASRIIAEPNAPTTIASHVRLWVDARSPNQGAIDDWLAELTELLRSGPVPTTIAVASRSSGQAFDPELRATLARAGEALTGRPVPEVLCLAGHDAGVLASQIPAGMVFVRNPTGISHSPAEAIDLADAEVAVELVARALGSLG